MSLSKSTLFVKIYPHGDKQTTLAHSSLWHGRLNISRPSMLQWWISQSCLLLTSAFILLQCMLVCVWHIQHWGMYALIYKYDIYPDIRIWSEYIRYGYSNRSSDPWYLISKNHELRMYQRMNNQIINLKIHEHWIARS